MDRQGARTARAVRARVPAPHHVIPEERLPPGFAAAIDTPPITPAEPRPAATVVLLRQGQRGPEVFLLRRNRSSGFVPGAYVFPGGRVDAGDAQPDLARLAIALPKAPPAPFWMASIRETFEETGVLLAHFTGTTPTVAELTHWREALLQDEATLYEVLEALNGRLDFSGVAHFAHWITPVAEPRRFDTQFFIACLPSGAEATADAREMSDALWMAPVAALEQFRAARLPMVFPTVHTLETLAAFTTVEEAIQTLRARTVNTILPRLVRTDGGIGIVIDQEN
jgi:8-oxo-dGTP pyrophosphatase MutT (NUDIX family)